MLPILILHDADCDRACNWRRGLEASNCAACAKYAAAWCNLLDKLCSALPVSNARPAANGVSRSVCHSLLAWDRQLTAAYKQ